MNLQRNLARILAAAVLAVHAWCPTPLMALGGFEGTFEYSIDAPWRMEPLDDPATGERRYGAIPIQISIHDAIDAGLDDIYRGSEVGNITHLGNVCSLTISEPTGTTTYDFAEFAEIEKTQQRETEIEKMQRHWPWPSTGPAPENSVCRAWRSENCATFQDVSATSEWHALVWHQPKAAVEPGDLLSLTVELKLTRHPETGCSESVSYERVSVSDGIFEVPSVLTLRNHLRVRYGDDPLPRFEDTGSDWLYGDLHYHSQGTDNEGEAAYNYRGVIRSMGAIGIDFLFATEHASNSEQVIDADFSIGLDIPSIQDWNPLDVNLHGSGNVLRDMSRGRYEALHEILYSATGVNAEAAAAGSAGVSAGPPPRGVLPQIYQGGEVDVIPEACSIRYLTADEVQAAMDAVAGLFEKVQIAEDAQFPYLPYGNGLSYHTKNLCTGWKSQIAPRGCEPSDILQELPDGTTLFRDVQGVNGLDFGREHMLFFPKTANPTVDGQAPFESMCTLCEFCPGTGEDTCNCRLMTCSACEEQEIQGTSICTPRPYTTTGNSSFVASNTGPYGGGKRRLGEWMGINSPPMLPEIEWKGFSFPAHLWSAKMGSPKFSAR